MCTLFLRKLILKKHSVCGLTQPARPILTRTKLSFFNLKDPTPNPPILPGLQEIYKEEFAQKVMSDKEILPSLAIRLTHFGIVFPVNL